MPTDTPGYTVPRVEHTMGQRSSDHCQITFDDCEVLPEQMLGAEGDEGTSDIQRLVIGRQIAGASP